MAEEKKQEEKKDEEEQKEEDKKDEEKKEEGTEEDKKDDAKEEEKGEEKKEDEADKEEEKEEESEEEVKIDDERFEKIIEIVEELNVVELSELVKAIEKKFGVSAAAPVAAAGAAGGGGGKSSYDVVLKEAGESKIQVIKAVKEITGKGLKEAKEMVDGAPAPIKEGVSEDEANEIKDKLTEAGGVVDLE